MTRSLRRVALASLFVAACGTGETRPSILLISIDTLRRDHVGTYGHPRPTTPVLDALASEGAAFENAVSTSNWTLPAHMSMWTGLSPSAHQVEDDRDGLAPEVLTFVETLRENGYATAGFASHAYLEARYGFSRGFDRYAVGIDQRAETVSRQAVAWLDSEPEPFFLFLHYFDPHWDYRPPIGFDTRFGARRPGAGRFRTLAPFFDPEHSMPGSLRRPAR